MNIREWFGYEGAIRSSNVDHRFDELLELFAKGVCSLFRSEPTDYRNVYDFVTEVTKRPDLSVADTKFISWFIEKGLPCLQKICGEKLPVNDDLIADFEFEAYNIEDELPYSPSDDMRICLINVVSYLPDRIERAKVQDEVRHITTYSLSDSPANCWATYMKMAGNYQMNIELKGASENAGSSLIFCG